MTEESLVVVLEILVHQGRFPFASDFDTGFTFEMTFFGESSNLYHDFVGFLVVLSFLCLF